MPSIGPSLPTVQAPKRKHEAEFEYDETTPLPTIQPSRPISVSRSSSAKRAREIGPTLPPANLDERPPDSADSDADSSSDDSFGPSLPKKTSQTSTGLVGEVSIRPADGGQGIVPLKTQRDEWMIVPPSSGDWSSRVDPTKLKNRKFNTGKGSKGPAQKAESNTNWTETPDEKKARLYREMMGIKAVSTVQDSPKDDAKSRENVRKLREYNEKSRGSTLYNEHQQSNPQEKEDDPSARAFDRDKDIAGGMKINHTQRRELMNKAADFGSRFSSGTFL